MRWITILFLVAANAWAVHPLDDLTGDEITRTVDILKASKKFTDAVRFPILALQEPDKEAILSGREVPRKALVAILTLGNRKFQEAVVDLTAGKVESVTERKGAEPPALLEEYEICLKMVQADPRWQAAMKKRGIAPESTAVDCWAPGLVSAKEKALGVRLMRGMTYLRSEKNESSSYYSRPVEGVLARVDMTNRKVLDVEDGGAVPIAKGDQDQKGMGGAIKLKPLAIKQPDGVSFSVDGHEVTWANWRFRFSMHPQKGLTLYRVAWKDQGRYRDVAYKLGLSEMVVPYGDPDKNWAFRNAFDLGEYGVGRSAHDLRVGLDAPETAQFFDVEFGDDEGKLMRIPQAIGLYEREPGGALWKHQDQFNRANTFGVRERELVLVFMTTVGNYDYAINYVFHLDGTLEVEADLTGILLAKGTKLTEDPCKDGCAHLVEPNVATPPHQHFFAFRADLDVDGARNTPVQMEAKALAGKLNPFANGFDLFQKPLPREKTAFGDLDLASSRKWKVISPKAKNALGHPTGYLLVPGENSLPYLTRQSSVRKRAAFVDHHVWFTRYHASEQGAAGDYPYQSAGGDGLPRYQSNDESLENEDVVLWYTFGITHIPRVEEWPVMSAHKAGFKLMPIGFFSRNPATEK